MTDNLAINGRKQTVFWYFFVLVMIFGWWVRVTTGVGLTGIVLGVWLLMAVVGGANLIVTRWNRWWVWVVVAVFFVPMAAVALELISLPE